MGPSSDTSCLGSEVSVVMEEDTVGGEVDLLSSLWIAAEGCDSPVSWGKEGGFNQSQYNVYSLHVYTCTDIYTKLYTTHHIHTYTHYIHVYAELI